MLERSLSSLSFVKLDRALEISIFRKRINRKRKFERKNEDERMLRTICSKTRSYHLFRIKFDRVLEISIFRKRIDGRKSLKEKMKMKECFERFVLIILYFSRDY